MEKCLNIQIQDNILKSRYKVETINKGSLGRREDKIT